MYMLVRAVPWFVCVLPAVDCIPCTPEHLFWSERNSLLHFCFGRTECVCAPTVCIVLYCILQECVSCPARSPALGQWVTRPFSGGAGAGQGPDFPLLPGFGASGQPCFVCRQASGWESLPEAVSDIWEVNWECLLCPLHCRNAPSAGGTCICFCSALHLRSSTPRPLIAVPCLSRRPCVCVCV